MVSDHRAALMRRVSLVPPPRTTRVAEGRFDGPGADGAGPLAPTRRRGDFPTRSRLRKERPRPAAQLRSTDIGHRITAVLTNTPVAVLL